MRTKLGIAMNLTTSNKPAWGWMVDGRQRSHTPRASRSPTGEQEQIEAAVALLTYPLVAGHPVVTLDTCARAATGVRLALLERSETYVVR